MPEPSEAQTVVVSTDFSDYGDAALPHAFGLATEHGARVVMVHVIDARPTPNPLYAHYYPIPTPEQILRIAAEPKASLIVIAARGVRASPGSPSAAWPSA
jgi:nucleotide-binding universal stress UspA family protein